MEAASSAINTPHPDGPTDDAEDFFGPEPTEEAASEPLSAPDGQPEPDAGVAEPSPASDATEAPVAPQEPGEAGETPAQRGSVEREYIVFQKLALTKENLKALLAEVEAGAAGKIRHAFFELHRPIARNDKLAVAETYERHHTTLGQECEVAAVSARSFKERHIQPEEVPAERRVRIT